MTGGAMSAPTPGAPIRSTAPHHVERGVAMLLKAVGLTPNGRLGLVASRLAWRTIRYRAARLGKIAA